MARPNKTGLDYFPLDIDFFDDEKIVAISGEFGVKGEIVAIKLLCAIYRNGYFILWSDLFKFKLLKNLPGVSSELFDSILNRLVLWGFFDKSLFDSMGVLTSVGIQKRYFKISKRRKSVDDFRYLLIEISGCENKEVFSSDDGDLSSDTVNVCNNGVNVCNNSFNADINVRKNITKERKVKESKENIIIPPTPPKGFEDLEKAISEKDHALNEALARIKELEEKIAKDNPAKPKRANSLNANARKAFEEHFRNTFGEEYYWTAKDAGNMSQLLRKLTFSREQRQMPVDDASVLYALQVFLTSVKDSWLLDNFSVANINSKYNEIVSKAKNGNSGKGTIGSTTTGSTEKFVCSKAEKGADRESDRAPQKDYSSRF